MKTKRHRTIHTPAGPAARALLESGRTFRALMNTTPYAILISDRKGHFLEANPAACRQLGYTRSELLRKKLFDIVGRDYLQRAKHRLSAMTAEKGFMESVHRRRDGSEFPVEVSVRRTTYKGGPALLGIVKDISAEKRALSELREREA
ncbi:MAG TPA: PAS domain S-box protein, partial [Elusimicrobiales bacterium]|nr:PAS domain S-box protein [Elusimicrobiales bacterium]